MDEDEGLQTATTRGSGQSVNIIMPNSRWQNAVVVGALGASLAAFVVSFFAFQELSAAEYWLQRNETFLEQLSAQGIHVPDDLLRHKEKTP